MTTPNPHYSSSESERSDIEDRGHSRSSSSSVEEIVKDANGRTVRKVTTTTTRRVLSSSTSSSVEAEATTSEQESTTTTTATATTTASASASSQGFIARVSALPLIHDSVSTLHSYAKDNKYSRIALDKAGNAVETVSKYTEGYQTKLQPHISKVDEIANKSLDLIETTFPIVTKPTAEIVTQVKKPYTYVEESSKSAYTQIQSTIDARVTVPVKTVTSTLATTATSTATQIATSATSTATQIANTVNTRATPIVDGIETIVNRYLPDSEVEETTAGQTNQATRVVDIGRAVSLRVSRRLSVGVAPITQSAHDLRKAAENNAALVKSRESLQALNIRLNALVEALRAHAKELQENVGRVPADASARVHTLSSSLLLELESLSVYLREHSPKLPEYVQVRLEPLVGFMNDRYAVVKCEISKSDVPAIQKARNILQVTTEETLPILQGAAQEVRESLVQYQVSIQENVQRGLHKVQEVNCSVSDAAVRAVHTARVTLVGGAK